MADAVMQAVNVTKDYETRAVTTRALDDVSLDVTRGEFSALAGPSGSGKTTLLNMLGTIDAPTSGIVRIDGDDVTAMSEAERSDLRLEKLGFIFQSYNLIPVLSATENVEFVLLLQGLGARERRARAEEVLVELGLGDLLAKRPTEMSGGQQQRVAVARAIASNPSIVLADEPTANLDSRTAESLLDLMLRMNGERGVTFLFSTHDRRVMDRARRIVQLVDGRIASDESRP
ncbi:MAG: ABC transporter ATP-binding protein [Deltaproteobacteria bacterium]|nr:ABC transporter ATP-binding protein [Deltaproteobacteria bacterium]MBW2414064.1 ABC transporter ATP-binding protein [Deltaproteobacteria bacterium]